MSKDGFIMYARRHPEFASHVLNGKVSWQQLYELYEIYGEDSNVWNNYSKNDFDLNSFKEVFKVIKNVDLESLQSGINSLQKTIGLIQDIGIKK